MWPKCSQSVIRTNMMSKEQSEIVKVVYNRFLESEESRWTRIDDILEGLAWLSDEELIGETILKYLTHCEGTFRCNQDHKDDRLCFAPFILESVEAILKLFEETARLHPKNAYILTYYLAISEIGLIYSSANEKVRS